MTAGLLMRSRFCLICTCIHGGLLLYGNVSQAGTPALPAPLDLQQAMAAGTEELQPALFAVRARQESARADIRRAESGYALEADINLEAARIQPNENAFDQSPNDSRASLNIRKPLYDFGYTGSRLQSAETVVNAEQLEYEHDISRQQIAVTRSFLDAILSDIKFAWDNEALATAFVRVDKLRRRFDLKQVSEVEVLNADADYQKMLTVRRNTEILQRVARAQLAEVINRPGELSPDMVTPSVDMKSLQLPDPDALIKHAMQSNIKLRAQAMRVAAAQEAMEAARKQTRPSLAAEVEVSQYSRDQPSNDDWRASLNLKIPLFENALVKSDVADKRALWLQQRAVLFQIESDVRKYIYDTWMLLNNMAIKAGELDVAAQAAERVMDRRRGEYELELRTDLGDALVNTSRVRYEQSKNHFDMIVAAMRLAMLTGLAPRSVIDNHKVSFPVNATGETNEN
jgi:outer membrane protein TolC